MELIKEICEVNLYIRGKYPDYFSGECSMLEVTYFKMWILWIYLVWKICMCGKGKWF